MLAADQGAVVTLNGGETWSSWYNQPTAADVPRGGRQRVSVSRLQRAAGERIGLRVEPRQLRRDLGSRLVPVGVDEYGYVAPDPLNPDIVYGGNGDALRSADRAGLGVGPVGGRGGVGGAQGNFRQVRTMPVMFSEVDKRALFFANNRSGRPWTAARTGSRSART